jgi:Yip1 domain
MTTFLRRIYGAAVLDAGTYEEVEADRSAAAQAVGVVLLASIAGGMGLPGSAGSDFQVLLAGVSGALVGWAAWAALTYLIGTRLLPEPQTRADFGQLLRTIAFASAPGLLRVLGIVPIIGLTLYAIASLWMLLAMIVAVRQALDYRSTARAVSVCVLGWALSLVIAAIIGIVFAPTVS